jgi:hypothetical protein
MAQILCELGIDDRFFIEGDVGAVEKAAQGLSKRSFGHTIFFEQDLLEVNALLERILHRFDQIALAEEALIDQDIERARIDRSADGLLHRGHGWINAARAW